MSLIKISTLKTWASIPGHELYLKQVQEIKKSILSPQRKRIIVRSTSKSNALIALMGKELDKDVYRIDLSAKASEYIGETERYLDKMFLKAESNNWILFFDEADALFGKRVDIKPGADRYTKIYVPYLLKRIEEYDGVIILSCLKCTAVISKFPGGFLLKDPE